MAASRPRVGFVALLVLLGCMSPVPASAQSQTVPLEEEFVFAVSTHVDASLLSLVLDRLDEGRFEEGAVFRYSGEYNFMEDNQGNITGLATGTLRPTSGFYVGDAINIRFEESLRKQAGMMMRSNYMLMSEQEENPALRDFGTLQPGLTTTFDLTEIIDGRRWRTRNRGDGLSLTRVDGIIMAEGLVDVTFPNGGVEPHMLFFRADTMTRRFTSELLADPRLGRPAVVRLMNGGSYTLPRPPGSGTINFDVVVTMVPEPSSLSLALWGAGAVFVLGYARKLKRGQAEKGT